MGKIKKNRDLREINVYEDIQPSGFINNKKLKEALDQLDQIKRIVGEMMTIRDNNNIPKEFIPKINGFATQVMGFIEGIEEEKNGPSEQVAREKDHLLQNITNYYNSEFNIDKSNNNLLLYHIHIKSFAQNIDPIKSLQSEFEELTNTIKEEEKKVRSNSEQSDTILNELKKKVSKQTISDYALIFKNEAKQNRVLAYIWLGVGILLSVIFVWSLFYFNSGGILATEVINEETNELIRYDISNLVTKLLLFALQIFLVSFSFKQYSINRHLLTLNKHRQNALNSYKLFTESIIGEDTNSRNALILQVARAIYEHTQSTGFLNEKGQSLNPGIIELTKIIGKPNSV